MSICVAAVVPARPPIALPAENNIVGCMLTGVCLSPALALGRGSGLWRTAAVARNLVMETSAVNASAMTGKEHKRCNRVARIRT